MNAFKGLKIILYVAPERRVGLDETVIDHNQHFDRLGALGIGKNIVKQPITAFKDIFGKQHTVLVRHLDLTLDLDHVSNVISARLDCQH